MPIVASKKICFIHIPKTGGTTIEAILNTAFSNSVSLISYGKNKHKFEYNKTTKQHMLYSEVEKIIPQINKWYSFAFVRNPWDRLYSEYRYRESKIKFKQWAKHILQMCSKNRRVSDNHIRPQVDFVPTSDSFEIYRFEQFESEIHRLQRKLQINVPIPHLLKATTVNEYVYRYDRELIDLVGEFYIEDVNRFGYSFDRPRNPIWL